MRSLTPLSSCIWVEGGSCSFLKHPSAACPHPGALAHSGCERWGSVEIKTRALPNPALTLELLVASLDLASARLTDLGLSI